MLILVFWIALVAYWAVAALKAKRNVGARLWGAGTGLRLVLVALILLALNIPPLRHALQYLQAQEAHNVLMGDLGVALCALGIGLAVFARTCLGRNWGMPMSRKEEPELVTRGPYTTIRHPIYTGLLVAMLGSAIGGNVFWLLPLILFGSYFVYSARHEEALMLELFPEQYTAYMKRTKMLVPFVL